MSLIRYRPSVLLSGWLWIASPHNPFLRLMVCCNSLQSSEKYYLCLLMGHKGCPKECKWTTSSHEGVHMAKSGRVLAQKLLLCCKNVLFLAHGWLLWTLSVRGFCVGFNIKAWWVIVGWKFESCDQSLSLWDKASILRLRSHQELPH